MKEDEIELVENNSNEKTASEECPLVMRDKSANAEQVENPMDRIKYEK